MTIYVSDMDFQALVDDHEWIQNAAALDVSVDIDPKLEPGQIRVDGVWDATTLAGLLVDLQIEGEDEE